MKPDTRTRSADDATAEDDELESWSYRVLSAGGRGMIRGAEFLIRRVIAREPFPDMATFEWTNSLLDSLPQIEAEVRSLLEDIDAIPVFQELSPEQARISVGAPWRSLVFVFFGRRSRANLQLCPATAAALSGIPGLTLAMFSVLSPGAEIAEHRGPFNGVLCYHLPIVVPQDAEACGLELAGEVRTWRVGDGFVFDDTYRHRAWNRSSEPRVVLKIDFHRSLPFPLAAMSRVVVWLLGTSPFGRRPMRKVADHAAGRVAGARRSTCTGPLAEPAGPIAPSGTG